MATNLKILLLIAFAFLVGEKSVFGQSIRFNNCYADSGLEVSRNIINYGNYYWVIGGTQSETGEQVIRLWKIDSLGNLLEVKDIGKHNRAYYHGWSGSSTKVLGNNFIVGGSYHDSLGVSRVLLLKFNSEGDTLWAKAYSFSNDDIGYDAIETHDGGYAIVGISPAMNGQLIARIIRVDSLGNMVWSHTYVQANTTLSFTIIETADHGFCIGGITDLNNQTGIYKQFLVKTDSLGNQEWFKKYNPINNASNPYIINTNDGNLAFCTMYTQYLDGSSNPNGYFNIVKVNISTGDTLWTRKYGNDIQIGQVLYSMIELQDGSLVATGTTYENGYQKEFGVILKTNANGEKIWLRYYQGPNITENFNTNQLYFLQKTNDNGFIACGFMLPEVVGNQDIWVLKTDTNGCIDAGCVNGAEELEEDDYRLFIYPNPAQDYISIDLPITHNKATVQIYNMQGQLVKTIAINGGGLQRIETTELSNGIYQLLVSSNSKLIGREKLVVTH